MKKVLALLMICTMLAFSSATQSLAFGAYTRTTLPVGHDDNQPEGWPAAVLAVAAGAAWVAAAAVTFAVGVAEGFKAAQEASVISVNSEDSIYKVLENNHDSSDFTRFDA